MSRISGQRGEFRVCATGGTPEAVLAISQWSIITSGSTDDVSANTTHAWKNFVPKLKSWSLSADAHWETNEKKICNANAVIAVGRELDFEGQLHTSYGYTFSGTVLIESVEYEVSIDGAVTYKISAKGISELTFPEWLTTTTGA